MDVVVLHCENKIEEHRSNELILTTTPVIRNERNTNMKSCKQVHFEAIYTVQHQHIFNILKQPYYFNRSTQLI